MVVKLRTLCRPENIIEHESVHRHKDGGWCDTRILCARTCRRAIKRGCQLDEVRGGGVVVVEGGSSLYLPAPRAGLENKTDAAPEEVPGPDIQVGVQQPEVAAF